MESRAIKQPTVRINLAAKAKLDNMQTLTHLSHPALLDRAIELLEQDINSKQLISDLADLSANPALLKQYQEISAVMEGAASDGLAQE